MSSGDSMNIDEEEWEIIMQNLKRTVIPVFIAFLFGFILGLVM